MIAHDELLDEVHYDPLTGVFTRLKTHRSVKTGDVAGAVDTANSIKKPYWKISIKGICRRAHIWAHYYMIGKYPSQEIDHINGDGLDNSWDNLRQVTHLENGQNQKKYKNNTSGVTGVHYRKDRDKWRARIMVAGKSVNLGHFNTHEEAVQARQTALLKYAFHENHGI